MHPSAAYQLYLVDMRSYLQEELIQDKKKSIIQYVCGKCGTHARVFSQTLAHGNCKNEIR